MPRALIPLFGIVFLDVLGFTIMIPLLPFAAQRFGAADVVVGLMLASTAACAALSSPLWGMLSDRTGRKRSLLGSQACSFVGYALLALAGSTAVVFVSRCVEGLGGGNLGVAQAYVSDLTTDEQRPKAFAFGAAAFGGGFIIGPILGGLLVKLGFAAPFILAAALQAVNMLLTAFVLPESHRRSRAAQSGAHALLDVVRTPAVKTLLIRTFLYIFSFTYFFTVFGLYLQRVLHEGPAAASFGLAVAGGIGVIAQLAIVPPLVARIGEARTALAAFALGAVAYAAMALVHGLASFALVLVPWALSGSILRPALTSLLSKAAPAEHRGLALSYGDALGNFAMIFAPPLGAFVIGEDPALTGVAPAVLMTLGFLLGLPTQRAQGK